MFDGCAARAMQHANIDLDRVYHDTVPSRPISVLALHKTTDPLMHTRCISNRARDRWREQPLESMRGWRRARTECRIELGAKPGRQFSRCDRRLSSRHQFVASCAM
jgi:hypothetical protein